MTAGRLAGGVRLQNALAQRAARPRKLALAAYALFGVAFVANFPQLVSVSLAAVALNAIATLAGTTLIAAVEARWTPSLRCPDAPLLDRSLQYATMIWLFSAALFGLPVIAAMFSG